MSLQSERTLAHLGRLRLTHLSQCYEGLAEEAAQKNLPYLDFLEKLLEAESQAKYDRNVKLKTQWAYFPYSKRLDQFDFSFQPSIDEKKIRELPSLCFLGHQENVILLGPQEWGRRTWRLLWASKPFCKGLACTSSPCRTWSDNSPGPGRRTNSRRSWGGSVSPSLLDEIGYLPLNQFGAICLFRLVSDRYEHGSMILTSDRATAIGAASSKTT